MQLVGGGLAAGNLMRSAKKVPVKRGNKWSQHHPIIMSDMGESLLFILPTELANALANAGAAQADVLGVPAAAGGGCAGDGRCGCDGCCGCGC